MGRSTKSGKENASGAIQVSSLDDAGRQAFNTIFGDRAIATRKDQVNIKFNLGIIDSFVTTTAANGGTATESNSRLLTQSSTATNGSIQVQSRDKILYKSGHDIFTEFTAGWLDEGVVGATQFIGPHDDDDGYRIGFNEENFCIQRLKGGAVVETINQTAFQHDTLDGNGPSGFTLDYAFPTIFRINFAYLGTAPALFEVYSGHHGGWIHFAYLEIDSGSELAIENPNLPVRTNITKTSGATNLSMVSGSWNAGYYNGSINFVGSLPQHYDTGTGEALVPATGPEILSVVVFHLKEIFNTKTNYVTAELLQIQANSSATSNVIKMSIVANPTSVGGTAVADLTYTDIATDSTMEYSSGGGVVVGGQELFTRYLVGGGQGSGTFSGEAEAEANGLVGKPGDYFVITYQRVDASTGNYTAYTTLNWIENF